MTSQIRMDEDVEMTMRDGTVLRADIYRPDDADKHPAIFSRAYHKVFGSYGHLNIIHAVRAGYALVSQVVRGRGASEGTWNPEDAATVEAQDGYDSVEWIAGQNWCDGNVGMMGFSHAGGMTAQTAMENPPHLKAIAPWSSGIGIGSQRGGPGGFRPPATGGVISFITALIWLPNEAADVVNRMEREGVDVSEMRRTLQWARNNPEEFYNYLPLKDVPFSRFERIKKLWMYRLQGVPSAAVSQVALQEENPYAKVTVPCSHLTGWFDGPATASFDSFSNMQKQGGSQYARESQHIICGPWMHSSELGSSLGAVNFGGEARQVAAGSQLLAFYDRFLRGYDTEIPHVQYFLMGRNQWRTADTWPLPNTRWQRFYLHSKGKANTLSGDGVLSPDEPGSEPVDTFVYDPHNPVPTVGGSMIGGAAGFGLVAGPLEQSPVEKRKDVLCYTTDELEEDVEITGPLEMHLFAATSARDTDFTAKLVDVGPDSRAYNLSDGIKRARGLKSESNPEPITPGEVYEYVIILGPTSQLFRKGHRIRIDISSSNFPYYDRNMNTGNPIGEDARGIAATQTIFHQTGYASYIDLPVIPGSK